MKLARTALLTALASLLLFSVLTPVQVYAHSGGLNAQGCHNNRKTGDYHCHRAQTTPTRSNKSSSSSRSINTLTSQGASYKNCTEARTAGAAPVKRGDPGYGTHLDRDGDGIGCE